MKSYTEHILTVLKILAWIVFIGLCIKCGTQLVAFVVGLINPDLLQKMYGIDGNWLKIREESQWVFICVMTTIIAISAFKANIWLMLIKLFSQLNLKNPFTMEVAKKLEGIAYQLIVIWIATSVLNNYLKGFEKYGKEFHLETSDAGEFLFVAGIVFIISQIFKRGIEIQEENELTV